MGLSHPKAEYCLTFPGEMFKKKSVYSFQINMASTDQRKDSLQVQIGEPKSLLGSLQEPGQLRGGHSTDMSKQLNYLPLI